MNYNLRKGMYLLMAILCVGWVQAKTIFVSPSGGGNGQSEDSPITLDEAISSVTGGTIIQLAEGRYKLSQALSLTDSLSIVGRGKSNTFLQGSIELNASSSDISLSMRDLTIVGTDNSSEHGIIGMIGTGPKKNILSLTNCAINAASSVTAQTASVGVRMESAGAELTMTDTDIDVHYYGIGIRNVQQKVTITNGTIIGWAAIMTSAGDLSVKDGTLVNTGTVINAEGAKLISRTLQVGKGNSYGAIVFQEKYNGVTANFTNCTVETIAGNESSLNTQQSAAFDMRSYGNTITFNGCTLKAEGALNYCSVTGGYANAAVIRLGWHGEEDKPSTDLSTPADNTITFIGDCSLSGKEREALVFSYRVGENKAKDKLTINGETYDAASGLICYVGLKDVTNGIIDCSNNLQSRVANAIAGETIALAPGDYDIVPTDNNPYGNYLPIIQDGISIVGPEYGDRPKIYSSTACPDDAWENQNLITIHGDNVKLENLSIQRQDGADKVIEVFGDNLTLRHLVINPGNGSSIDFNSPNGESEQNIGDVTLSNLGLNQSRITFSGAKKGNVTISNVSIWYRNVYISGISQEELQRYSPIGDITGKSDLKFDVQNLNVVVSGNSDTYHLDANMVANLPMNTTLKLDAGDFAGFDVINEGITIIGNKRWTKIIEPVTISANNVTLKDLKFTTTSTPAVTIAEGVTGTKISHNYWGEIPDFNSLLSGKADPSPYYIDEAMTLLAYGDAEITTEETWSEAFDGRNVTIKAGGQLTLGTTMTLGTVTIEEGGQLIPAATSEMKAASFVFIPTLDANKWKALGTPFESSILVNSESNKVSVATADANEGIWFASLKEDNQPEIVVKNSYSTAGLWASTEATNYRLVATDVTFAQSSEPTAPQSGLQMFVNPNTYNIKLNQSAYILNEEGTVFELTENPTIKAFQSFVLADSNTTATLRSIGTTDPNATGNEFVVKEGYYLTTERGAIVVHTAEPMELYVVAVSGAVVYRGTVTNGERIAVPTGIYAVNGQMVRVK